ncbi:hypothetical protein K435DRAFT_820407 [Dendrothele bispora CBS 962.96]|uniref:Uncharacterized protein n=1 Tax=Dendrothele bispora (strain CBS 962.96) TaxID=1314807 RepID=A0A4S8LTG4_DENBC|nr:hypothetical protein K435DRAFT_820407 [Dendrothele bispora CBS 962.96]
MNESHSPSSFSPVALDSPSYPHVSSYRTSSMEVRVWSPSVKVMGSDSKLVPVYGDGDKVEGVVTLDSKSSPSGRLVVTIEGSFHYNPPDPNAEGSYLNSDRRKHVFYSSSTSTPVMPLDSFLNMAPPTRSTMTFGRLKRRPSATSLNTPPNSATTPKSLGLRTYPFSFELPRGWRSGEELPPTFVSSYSQSEAGCSSSSSKNTAQTSGSFGVEYKISVSWEPYEASESPSLLDVPVYYHSDPDFHSLDGVDDKSWLEMPLRSERPIPFRCAVTLPTSVTFSRHSSIPYYVVFTTTPRNPVLTREIASDATISVTLMRQITVTESSSTLPTPPQTPSGSSTSDEGGPVSSRGKLFNRVKNGPWSPRTGSDENFDSHREKPLPRLPMHTVFKETRLLHTSICIGFPKRPRQQTRKGEKHPSLDSQSALPDGLHKAKFVLNKDMLPSIDWSGVTVKYYLDVSVLVGQDDVRARIPIRIV